MSWPCIQGFLRLNRSQHPNITSCNNCNSCNGWPLTALYKPRLRDHEVLFCSLASPSRFFARSLLRNAGVVEGTLVFTLKMATFGVYGKWTCQTNWFCLVDSLFEDKPRSMCIFLLLLNHYLTNPKNIAIE